MYCLRNFFINSLSSGWTAGRCASNKLSMTCYTPIWTRCPRLVSQVRGDWVMLILIQICIEPGFQPVKNFEDDSCEEL